jgi:predicted phosphodiesterase
MAVGCSHGNMADPVAIKAVLKFRDAWKPHTTVHLGDFIDLAAFRSGAKGSNDESEPVRPDFDSGIRFLKDLQPQIVLAGNHEDRLWRLRESRSAIVAELATALVSDIERACRQLRCELVPYRYKTYRTLGNYKLMHGYFYNENAARDHAEAFGNTIYGHTHRTALEKGRRDDNPTGICPGTLSNIPNMDYAKTRKSTLSWAQGLVWGLYCDTRTICWLHEQPQDQPEWVLPI